MKDDMISREAAIDAIGKTSDELYENIKKGATFPQRQWFDGMAQAQSILENLPSAQPEDCDTCKHGYFGDSHCDNCRVRYQSHYERRTDDKQRCN